MLITISGKDVDIRASILDTDRSTTVYADAPNRRMGIETLLVEPPHDGIMTLRIERNDQRDARGTVRVTAVVLPTATPGDRRRLEAARLEATACLAFPDLDRGKDSAHEFLAAADLHRRNGDRLRYGTALLHAAGARYVRLADWKSAADLAARAKVELHEAHAPAHSAYAARVQGAALNMVAGSRESSAAARRQTMRKARRQLARAAEQLEALGNFYEAGYALNYLGVSYYEAGDRTLARSAFHDALEHFKADGDGPAQALSLQSLAYLDFEDGRLADSMREFDAALALIPRVEEPENFAHTLHNSGQPLMVLGRFDEAITRFHEAGQILGNLGDRDGEARALHSMGTALAHAGEVDRARALLQSAIRLRQATGVRREQAVSLIALGRIERDSGNLDAAIELHRQAARLVNMPDDRARTLLALAQDYLEAGELAAARAALNEILTLDLGRLHRHRGLALTELGTLEALERRADESRAAFSDAIAIHRENGSELELARALHRRAEAMLAFGDTEAVLADTDAALRLFEGVGLAGTQAEGRAVFRSSYRGTVELRIAALLRTANAARSRGDPDTARELLHAALNASDRSRAQLLTDDMGIGPSNQGIAGEPLVRRREIYESLAASRLRHERLLDEVGPEAGQVSLLERQIAVLRTEATLIEARIARQQARGAGTTGGAGVDLIDTVPTGVRVAEFFVGGRHAWRFDIQDGAVTVQELPDPERLKQLARQLHESWRTPGADEANRYVLAGELARIAFAIPADSPSPQFLRVIPDGALHLVPMAVIADLAWKSIRPGSTIVVPSLNAMRLRTDGSSDPRGESLAIIADPVFSAADPRLHLSEVKLARLHATNNGSMTRGGGSRDVLPRLPAAAAEAREIIRFAGPSTRVLALTGFDASRTRIQSEPLGEFRIIHFATHAFADSQDPALAMLALSRLDAAGNPTDGTLRSHEIAEWRLNADLVVLSGCETALGRELEGEGPIGLSQAFLRSGARSVVASLWKVPDSSTAALMREFYRELILNDRNAAVALHRAQQAIRRQNKWSDPYYWAGFQLVSISPPDGNNDDVATRGE